MEPGGAVDSVAIKQRHCRHLEMLAHAYQFLGQRSAFEKAESGTSVKFDVHQNATDLHGFSQINLGLISVVIRANRWQKSVIASFKKPFPAEQVMHKAVERDGFAVF